MQAFSEEGQITSVISLLATVSRATGLRGSLCSLAGYGAGEECQKETFGVASFVSVVYRSGREVHLGNVTGVDSSIRSAWDHGTHRVDPESLAGLCKRH
jgi:hypothetical protein